MSCAGVIILAISCVLFTFSLAFKEFPVEDCCSLFACSIRVLVYFCGLVVLLVSWTIGYLSIKHSKSLGFWTS